MTTARPYRADRLTDVARAWPPGSTARIRPGFAGLWLRILAAFRGVAQATTPRARPERQYYPPRRESFMEEAAMAREMWRL